MNLRKFVLFICYFVHFLTYGQFNNFKFENLDTSEGLSSSTCTEIFQDSDGVLWFGTIDGLNRYDGYGFKVYRPGLKDPNTISNNRINVITEDKAGNLWVGTNSGLNVLDKKTRKFRRVPLFGNDNDKLGARVTINDLYFDTRENRLWAATKNGIVRFSLRKDLAFEDFKYTYFTHDPRKATSLNHNDVSKFNMDVEGHLWAVTRGRYLNRYMPQSDSFERVYIGISEPFELNHLPKNLLITRSGNFWIGNDLSRIVVWDKKDNSFELADFAKKRTPIFDMYQDRNGTIWVATDGDGLFLVNEQLQLLQHMEYDPSDQFSLPNNQPSHVLEDTEGTFWIASYNKGVSKFNPAKSAFGHYYYQEGSRRGLSTPIAQAVLEDSKGRIWIGTDGGGLNKFDEKTKTFDYYRANPDEPDSIASDKILFLCESHDGTIWVCTWDGGLSNFDPETENAKNYAFVLEDPYSLGQNTVWTAVEDQKKRLWLGTQTAGLNLMDPNTGNFHKYTAQGNGPKDLLSNLVFSLFIDSQNRLLIGTSMGLCYVDLDGLTTFIPEDLQFITVAGAGLAGQRINHITEDREGNIWLGTDTGLYTLDENLNMIKFHSTGDDLPNSLVVGVQQDDNLEMWITTKSGLSRWNHTNGSFTNFNVRDGIQGIEFQSKSITKTSDGHIIAGGINGFNLFHPDSLPTQKESLIPQINGLKIFNKEVEAGDTINGRVLTPVAIAEKPTLELKYSEANLTFEFGALYYQNQDRVAYAYRMLGANDEFIEAGPSRTATYSNLPPGDYEFEVMSVLDGQWENAQTARIKLSVAPPPWKTWWAYTVYSLAFLTLLWAGIFFYTKRMREEKEHELDQMKLRFFVNLSHEFRTPLTLILNPVDKILSNLTAPQGIKASATTIQRSASRLLHLVNQLLDYRKMDVGMSPLQIEKGNIVRFCEEIFSLFEELATKKGIEFKFEAATKNITTHFDFDKVEKIITNLISNAIKFTDTGGCIVISVNSVVTSHKKAGPFPKIEKGSEHVEIVVSDSGIGLKEEQLKNIFSRFYHPDTEKSGTGIGLNFTKALVEMHGGHISVESQRKKGSTFTVRLPIDVKSKPTQIENVKNKYLFHSVKAIEYEITMTDNESSEEEIGAGSPSQTTILIVEDNRELRMHLTKDLRNDYNVKEAANGAKGLKLAKKWYPDLIISDVMMPKMDGFEMCRQLKEDFDTCHIPVLLLTAKTLEIDRIEGYDSGADGYLDKPFVTSVLKARIRNLLKAKNRLRQRFSEIGGLFPSREVTSNNLDEAFLDKATKIILENIEDFEFKQEDLLQELGIGRSQLYRKISSLIGNNPSYFIRTIKLRYASGLLLKRQHSIKEVTYMCGFNSTAYFSKTFRELFKVTPTEYIEQNGKANEVLID